MNYSNITAEKAVAISYLVLASVLKKTNVNCVRLFSVARQLKCYIFIELRPRLNLVFVSACFVRICSMLLMISEDMNISE